MAMNAAEKARIAGRKEAVKAGTAKGLSAKESRKRYYVRTRVAELEKAGKPVSAEKRKQLREKFNSGDVSRRGFAAPKKRVSSSSSSSSSPSAVTPSVSKGRSATSNMKGVSGYKAGSTKPSSKVSKVEKKKSSGGVLGSLKGAKRFLDNNIMGKDDSKRAADYILKGDYKKAAKSVGGAALELGSLVGVGGVAKGIASRFGGKGATSGSRVLKGTLVKSTPKAITSGPKALGTGAKSAVSRAPKAVTRKPVAKKPSVKKPVAKKPVAKKPVAKKPVAKKPAAKKSSKSEVSKGKVVDHFGNTYKDMSAYHRR
jgi:hypothetical protein